MAERQRGTVKWFDSAKGYGFIIKSDGEDVFVHYRSILGEGYRSLEEGQVVDFVATHGEKGWQASEVVATGQTVEPVSEPVAAQPEPAPERVAESVG